MTGYVNLINLSYGNGGYDDHMVNNTERPRFDRREHAPSPSVHDMTAAANMGILAHSPHNPGAEFIIDNRYLGFEKHRSQVSAVGAGERAD